jgi:thiamine-monophosphate kinase
VSPAPSEDEWIEAIAGRFERAPGALLGIGHDTEALRVGEEGTCIVSTDVLVDGRHFDLAACGGRAAGRKALAVNLSDLAAAASRPLGFLVGAVLPRPADRALFEALADGMAETARRYGCPCLGGDTNAGDGPLVLAITVVGAPGPMGVVSRKGARPGDVLSVTGPLGGSRRGRHLDPVPRIAEALALAEARLPHAMMDLSDGLSRDLPRLCAMSGVGARIDAALVPVHEDVGAEERLAHALHDGEDYELLVAHAPLAPGAAPPVPLWPVGRVTAAADGIVLATGEGEAPIEPRGWDHLAD